MRDEDHQRSADDVIIVYHTHWTNQQDVRMAKKKGGKLKGSRSSRFFDIKTHTAKVSINSTTSSKYFVDSPSSAVGSFRSMPNFLRTLIPPDIGHIIQDAIENEKKTCSCAHLSKAARKQFAHCPIFEQTRSFLMSCDATSSNDLACCDKEILILHQSVLHMCTRACYLRAFAPLRDWHSLRTSVAELSGRCPGKKRLANDLFGVWLEEMSSHIFQLAACRLATGRMEVQLGRVARKRYWHAG
jgi:hypothetical protein